MADTGSLESIEDYLEYLPEALSVAEQQTLAGILFEERNYTPILTLLLENEPAHIPLLVKTLIALGEKARATEIYKLGCTRYPEIEDQEISLQLELSKAELHTSKPSQTRPKLHVVEKTSMEEVIDLVRYRQDSTTFADVVGLEHVKKQINKKIILPFQKPSIFQKFKKF